MIAEEETNKETITVLTTDQIIDQIMVLSKETIVRTMGQAIDQTMVLNKETIDRTMAQDLITGLTMAQDLITGPTTDQLILRLIN